RAGDRVRGRGDPRRPGPGYRGGRRRCGAGRLDFPLRRIHYRTGQGGDARRGHRDPHAGSSMTTTSDPIQGSRTWIEEVRWNADGLVPAIAQDATTLHVLTLAWMNREALERSA